MPSQTTQQIKIDVEPAYQTEYSSPENNYYFWTYTICIENTGSKTVQLISRHWIITDQTGHIEEVKGEGVVGEQPVLEPGEKFTYTSGCPLPTPTGSMQGTYQMVSEEGAAFNAEIPRFELIGAVTLH